MGGHHFVPLGNELNYVYLMENFVCIKLSNDALLSSTCQV